ncbi:MAG: NAD-dependent epimerase/dehydratase family protein [Syntrophus sp. (in: bacteria)]
MKQYHGIKMPSLRGQRILITGGLGFIGSNLAHMCLELGAEVTIYDCMDPSSGGNLYNIHDIRDFVQLCHYDILNMDRLSEHIFEKDIIFNCAASTSHPFSIREPWMNLDVNSRAVINLLEAIRRFNREAKFIHLGTSTQLGKLHYQPADENHPEFPTDIYSANKTVAEKYVLIYANIYGLRATVIRISNTFGPRASIHSSDFTFNNYFIGLALQNKTITVFGDGAQKRNSIFVDNVVAALILSSQTEKTNKETLFAVSDEHLSVADIAKATVKFIGSGKVKLVEWPKDRKPLEIGDAIISNKKIKSLINWKPLTDLKAGLLLTKEYYETCLDKYLR